jgi:hypothetical protein
MSASENVLTLPKRVRYSDALIAPGEYDARVLDYETRLYWRGAMGAAFETVLPSYYAVKDLIGPPRRHGRFKPVGMKSRLARDLAAMLRARPPLDHFPLKLVIPHIHRVSVVTVERDHEQQNIPTGARYSKVDRVLERVQ